MPKSKKHTFWRGVYLTALMCLVCFGFGIAVRYLCGVDIDDIFCRDSKLCFHFVSSFGISIPLSSLVSIHFYGID